MDVNVCQQVNVLFGKNLQKKNIKKLREYEAKKAEKSEVA